jgi:hypothetical protein
MSRNAVIVQQLLQHIYCACSLSVRFLTYTPLQTHIAFILALVYVRYKTLCIRLSHKTSSCFSCRPFPSSVCTLLLLHLFSVSGCEFLLYVKQTNTRQVRVSSSPNPLMASCPEDTDFKSLYFRVHLRRTEWLSPLAEMHGVT